MSKYIDMPDIRPLLTEMVIRINILLWNIMIVDEKDMTLPLLNLQYIENIDIHRYPSDYFRE